MTDERYWGNSGGRHWLNATNRNGIEMGHCDQLHREGGQGRLRHDNLAQADQYDLDSIHRLAERECASASQGTFAGYGWTDKLCYYAGQTKFRDRVVTLGPLPAVPDPQDPASVQQCIHDRQVQYRRHLTNAAFDLEREKVRHRESADAREQATQSAVLSLQRIPVPETGGTSAGPSRQPSRKRVRGPER